MSELSFKNQQALDALRSAVAEALERKRRLGQYAVIWKDGRVVRLNPDGTTSSFDQRKQGAFDRSKR